MKFEIRKVSKPKNQGRVTVSKFDDGEEVVILPSDSIVNMPIDRIKKIRGGR